MRTKGIPEKIYIGLDNGITGSIGWVDSFNTQRGFIKVPIFSCLNYQKEIRKITRINTIKLWSIFLNIKKLSSNWILFIERPMVNPKRFQASCSALRALEASLIVVERLGIPHQFLDSGEWQKEMLPKGIKGTDVLKAASKSMGQRLYPELDIKEDADGILIAEWARSNRK